MRTIAYTRDKIIRPSLVIFNSLRGGVIVQEKFYIRKISFFKFLLRFLFSTKKVVKEKVIAHASVDIFSSDHFFPTQQKKTP